ncbi:MAG: hypothetical protein ACI4XA_01745 [Oscillospiraceae bacterium]
MLIFSQDRKFIIDCAAVSVTKNFGGGKDGKFALIGAAAFDTDFNSRVIATFPDEKTAMDALEKLFEAFSNGAASYKL